MYWDDFSLSDPIGPGGGQQFGYDGFGNLLSQSAIFGSSPFMTLTVNPNTNQVTGTGVVFDAAGNMTQDGGVSYGYDSMNRLTSAGTASYSYSPGENKRMVVYSNISPTPQLNMYLYGPNGKVLSKFLFEPSGSQWDALPGSQTNYFYLGTKALNWAENNVGSTTASQFWPYGQTVGGGGRGVFATYQPDPSGFLYADQRYYNQTWGRFVTADASDANIDPTISGSYNRYAYVNGDPADGMDANGLGDGPGEGCVYETANTIVCFSGPVVQVPSTGSNSGPVYDTGMTIQTSSAPASQSPAASLPDAPTYLASDGGPNDPTAASQGQSAPTSTGLTSAPSNSSVAPVVICGGTYGQPCTPVPPPSCSAVKNAGNALKLVGGAGAIYKGASVLVVASGGAELPEAAVAMALAGIAGGLGTVLGVAAEWHIGCIP